MGEPRHQYQIFGTAHGFCGIAWGDTGVVRFCLPARTPESTEKNLLKRLPGAKRRTPPTDVQEVIAATVRYFSGERIEFADVRVDLGPQDSFFLQIYAAARRIGWGDTTTYGTLAKELGAGPEAARDVGVAMAKNPIPLIIPCHRVLAAGRKIGGFSAPGGAQSKLRMLELEGFRMGSAADPQQSLAL